MKRFHQQDSIYEQSRYFLSELYFFLYYIVADLLYFCIYSFILLLFSLRKCISFSWESYLQKLIYSTSFSFYSFVSSVINPFFTWTSLSSCVGLNCHWRFIPFSNNSFPASFPSQSKAHSNTRKESPFFWTNFILFIIFLTIAETLFSGNSKKLLENTVTWRRVFRIFYVLSVFSIMFLVL